MNLEENNDVKGLKEEINVEVNVTEKQNNVQATMTTETTQTIQEITQAPKAPIDKPETFEKKPLTRETTKANPLPHTMRVTTRKKK